MGARGAAVTALVVALVLCASWAAVALLAVVAHRREAHARAAAEAELCGIRSTLVRVLFDRYLNGQIGARLCDRLINAQGRAITGPDGRRQIGPGGLGWFTAVPGGSLRRVEARVALRGGA